MAKKDNDINPAHAFAKQQKKKEKAKNLKEKKKAQEVGLDFSLSKQTPLIVVVSLANACCVLSYTIGELHIK